jgi:PAS domain S-box-containing protein
VNAGATAVTAATDDLVRDGRSFAAILAHVSEGITIQVPGGALVYANPAALELVGFDSLDELLETPIADVIDRFDLFDEDGARLSPGDLPGRAVLRGEIRPPVELRFRVKATGEERYAVVRSEPIHDDAGALLYVVNTFHDLTEERHTERSLRFLSDAGAVLSTSLDYEETLRNLTRLVVPLLADWCAIDVLDAGGEVRRVGMHHTDPAKLELAGELQRRFPPDPDSPSGVHAVLRSGRSLLVEEVADAQIAESPEAQRYGAAYIEIIRRLGLRSVIVAPLLAGDRVTGALTLVLAESGRRFGPRDRYVAELLGVRTGLAVQNSRLYHEAEEAVALRDRFLQVAAHELLTPVTIVRGYAQSLQRLVARELEASPATAEISMDAARLQRSVGQVDRASERLTQLIGDLLDVTRMHQGSLVPVPRPMNLSALMRSAIEGIGVQQAGGRYPAGVLVHFELPPDGDVVGTWDETRLEQVVFNVLDNALKYSEGDGIRVRLWLEDDEAHIEVSDTGLGIPSDQLELIFEPFHRTGDANLAASGMGMGLAVCREIMARHGGWIRASSPGVGQGSTFSIGLPGASISAEMVGVEPA